MIRMMQRLAVAAALLGSVGLGCAGLAHAAPFDVEHATQAYLNTLQGAARARSDAYFDGGIWVEYIGGLVTVLACWVMVRLRLLAGLRTRMERSGWRPWIVTLACAALFLLVSSLIMFPWSIWADYVREKNYGLMNQTFGEWLGDQGIALALTMVFGSLMLLAIMAVIRRAPRRWWLLGTGVVTGAMALMLLLFPVFVAPMFNTYRELPAGPVRDRIVAMAQARGVPSAHIYLVDASRQSDRISANVSGIGPTVRISLNDNLLKRGTVPQVAAVMGHEMGHYVLRHLWWTLGALALLTAVMLWMASRVMPALVVWGGRRWALRDIADPAAIPVLIGVYAALSLLASPLTNAIVRIQESEADVFGLDVAREPDGFASIAMELSQYRKIDPPAWEEALFYDHPSGATRVRMAMQWKKDHVANAVEVVPPPMAAKGPGKD
ncbi:M48 family metallopeptidase [Novosphingobium cyanobacteriorum]|uniref:M48 family metallopeptidase n=1 Tax=Novosphingobium cyanobacteriorum TaxID=3024215 RepID=A0ABT6CH70_9SPHN|nr:M48 family metallopeptidase [Novosphingobium cyanobacteriorum]MDF8332828.1 M48 family metallopeptidase [Novosphingobium cyanobacteriorum]